MTLELGDAEVYLPLDPDESRAKKIWPWLFLFLSICSPFCGYWLYLTLFSASVLLFCEKDLLVAQTIIAHDPRKRLYSSAFVY
jgi:hypothetical protein